MSETTPRPWEVTERQYSVYAGEPRWQIADVQHSGPFWTALVLNEDDARLIVRAVNAHEGLVEALEHARTVLADNGYDDRFCEHIDAALAKAKEGL